MGQLSGEQLSRGSYPGGSYPVPSVINYYFEVNSYITFIKQTETERHYCALHFHTVRRLLQRMSWKMIREDELPKHTLSRGAFRSLSNIYDEALRSAFLAANISKPLIRTRKCAY